MSYRPVALFNAADLEGEALEGLIQKRRQAEGALLRPEPERLADATVGVAEHHASPLAAGEVVVAHIAGAVATLRRPLQKRGPEAPRIPCWLSAQ